MARRDLTSGSIPRGLLGLAIPMIAGSVLHSIQSMVDMYFVGGLGPRALAAVGMSGSALMILITVFIGLNISTGALVSRSIGAKDVDQANLVAGQAMLLTLLLSVAVSIAGYLGSTAILRALNASPEVVRLGRGYLHITFGGVFFMCAMFVMSGILHGAGDAVTPLLLGALTTVCNCVLNPILIRGYLGCPALGVRGSALATVLSRMIAFALALSLLLRGRLPVRLSAANMAPHGRTIWRLVTIGVPGSIGMSVRAAMNLALMAVVGAFGAQVVAGYVVGMRVRMIGMMPLFGLGGAAAAMVGQNLGARRPDRARRCAWTAVGMAAGAAALSALAFALFAPWIVRFFSAEPEAVAAGAAYLRITAVGLVTAAVGVVLSRALSGAGDTVSPLLIAVAVLWGVQIPAAVLLSGVRELWGMTIPRLGLIEALATNSQTGVWYAMIISSALQAAVISAWFTTGKWQRKRIL